MVSEDGDTSARGEQVARGDEHITERAEFIVDLDTQGLEESREFFGPLGGYTRGGDEVFGSENRLLAARPAEVFRDSASAVEFAVEVEDAREVFFGIGIDDVGGGALGGLVHPHVERRREAETEAAFGTIEMVEADAEVGEQSVDSGDAVVIEPVAEVSEVTMHESPPRVVDGIGERIGILVEREETAAIVR